MPQGVSLPPDPRPGGQAPPRGPFSLAPGRPGQPGPDSFRPTLAGYPAVGPGSCRPAVLPRPPAPALANPGRPTSDAGDGRRASGRPIGLSRPLRSGVARLGAALLGAALLGPTLPRRRAMQSRPCGQPLARPPGRPPFVLPQDEEHIQRFNETATPSHRVRLELLPEPFLGNPRAPVVLLGLCQYTNWQVIPPRRRPTAT